MRDNEIPCYQCLMIVLCKHKRYAKLLHECSLLDNLLYNDKGLRFEKNRKPNFKAKLTIIDRILDTNFKRIIDFCD